MKQLSFHLIKKLTYSNREESLYFNTVLKKLSATPSPDTEKSKWDF